MTVSEALKEKGFYTIDDEFYSKIAEWKSWYRGNVKNFSYYKVRTGKESVKCKRYSLGMAKKVCEDWADLLMNERVSITVDGAAEQEFLDSVFEENNFFVKANETQELKSALGTAAYVVRVTGQIEGETASGLSIDYVSAEHIYPISWANGLIDECAFSKFLNIQDEQFVYLQIHHKNTSGLYEIVNAMYSYRTGSLSEIPINSVPGFENIPTMVATNSEKKMFVIDRLNIKNNVETDSPMGISVFANAIDVLKGVDIVYDSYVNEFSLGKKRIMAKLGAMEFLDGEPAFDPNDTVFYALPEDVSGNSIIEQIDMSLRTDEHDAGIQAQLNLLSAKCGLGNGYYKYSEHSVSTATQIISENSAMFRTLKKHEVILDNVIKELCRIILRFGNLALGGHYNEEVEIIIDFDDSIIEDKQSEFSRDMQLLNAGIMNDWEFRAKWMNEDEETAKQMLPGMEEMVDERQSEVE